MLKFVDDIGSSFGKCYLLLSKIKNLMEVNLLIIQHKQSSRIQTNKTWGQPYGDASPNEVSFFR